MNYSTGASAIKHLKDVFKSEFNALFKNVTFRLIADGGKEIKMVIGLKSVWCVVDEFVLLEFYVVSVPRTTPRLRRQLKARDFSTPQR